MLAGSKSFFVTPEWDLVVLKRLIEKDIQLSAPLWGRGKMLPQGEAAEVETLAMAELSEDCYGLEHLFHYRFCQKHIRAEWFALTDEDIAFIRTLDGPPPRPFPEDHPDNIEIPWGL